MDPQPASAVVNKTLPAKLIHEQIDPPPTGTDQFRQSFLGDIGNRFSRTFLIVSGQKEKRAGQTLLTGIAKLIY